MSVTLLRADARSLPLADNSVDLIVTSPPYFALRSYKDGGEHYAGQLGDEPSPHAYVDALVECTAEMIHVLKPSGSIWINLGDKYATASNGTYAHRQRSRSRSRNLAPSTLGHGIRRKSLMGLPWRYALRCIDDLGLILRQEVVWSKPNGVPESMNDRARRSHEVWFHFTLNGAYYADVDQLRESYAGDRSMSRRVKRSGAGKVGNQQAGSYTDEHPLGSLPGSVRSVPIEPLTIPDDVRHARCCSGSPRSGCDQAVDHYAAFPLAWPRWIIPGWSPPGGLVLDPFGGTGTTALVADVLGRHGISVDMSADYQRIARWRTTDPRQRAKAARRPYAPPQKQIPGQEGLFDLGGETA